MAKIKIKPIESRENKMDLLLERFVVAVEKQTAQSGKLLEAFQAMAFYGFDMNDEDLRTALQRILKK